jgi:hypothetical protein
LTIVNGNGGGDGDATQGDDGGNGGPVSAHSFVVRVLPEPHNGGRLGIVTDTATGERQVWRRPSDVARFIERRLGEGTLQIGVAAMARPTLNEVVTKMLKDLGDRLDLLPPPPAAVPKPNVTVERIAEKLVGLGNQRGTERTESLGERTLRGGRLDARLRFQLWGDTAKAVDDAVLTLQTDLLDNGEDLRQAGFLRLNAADTTLAERVESVGGWRKATSYDVLFEYQYVDTDDADSLIVRIPVTLDPELVNSPDRELQTVTDEMARWDNEAAPALQIRGPATVRRISALVFVPGPALGGDVIVARSDGSPGAVTHLHDLAGFLAATGGSSPTATNADVTLTPANFFAGLVPTGDTLALGDWDTDGSADSYTGFDRRLDQPIELAGPEDRLIITYKAPPGPATGLDQTAVVYLRVNAP